MQVLAKIKHAIGSRLYKLVKAAETAVQEYEKETILARAKRVGEGVRLNGRIRLTGADALILGNNVHIGDNAFIRAEGGLTIGDNTHISRNCVIYTINHRTDGERIPYDDTMEHRAVAIGRNTWIGMNVCIVPGSTIGDGAIIGMGTVVAGNIPERSIVVGSKWRIVGYRDADHYDACDRAGQFGAVNGKPLQVTQETPKII